MANKEILAVEIDDSAFAEFKRKFDEYNDALKSMPEQWRAATSEITEQASKFEVMRKGAEEQNQAVTSAAESHGKFNETLDAASLTWLRLSKHGHLFAANIIHSTRSLMQWTKLTAVFSGLLGAGGLFGISRMAQSVAQQRTSAAGLGVTYGEQTSFLTSFGRLGDPEGILRAFSEAETDVTKKYALRQYLGHTESGDPARDFAEGLGRFKTFVDQFKKTPELLGPQLRAHGYDKLGITTETARTVQGMSAAEIAQIGGAYKTFAERLGLPPNITEKWTDLTSNIEKAGEEIDTVFWRGTKKLTEPLENLSQSFVTLVKNCLKEGSPISKWITAAGKGLDRFANDLGSGDVQRNVRNLGREIGDVVRLFENLFSSAPGGIAVLAGIAAASRIGGGAAAAAGTALARSGTMGALASGAGVVLGPVGALAAGGLVASSGSTNESMPERERQRRFHQGPFAPGAPAPPPPPLGGREDERARQREYGQTPPAPAAGPGPDIPAPPHRPQPSGPARGRPMPTGVFPERVPAAPKSLSDKSAIFLGRGGHHPRRYQGKMKIGDESFDYASGSLTRGRGSSPFGDHPITGFDPSAMHGRGGGAFRTKDVLDPQTGDKRGAVEIHMSRQDDVDRVQTAGCFGIPQSQWPGAKTALQKQIREHGAVTLRVYPNGNAQVVSNRSPVAVSIRSAVASYAAVHRDRRSFGHPHVVGHHPATVGRTQHSMIIEDHTGGMVHISSNNIGDP